MTGNNSRLDELIEALKRQRDELALKIHLGKADAKDEWERLEKRLAELNEQSKPFQGVVGDTARGVGSALDLAADELKKGYDRLRKLIG